MTVGEITAGVIFSFLIVPVKVAILFWPRLLPRIAPFGPDSIRQRLSPPDGRVDLRRFAVIPDAQARLARRRRILQRMQIAKEQFTKSCPLRQPSVTQLARVG